MAAYERWSLFLQFGFCFIDIFLLCCASLYLSFSIPSCSYVNFVNLNCVIFVKGTALEKSQS